MAYRTPLLLLCFLFVSILSAAQSQPYWDDPAVYRLNKVQPHDRICPEGAWHIELEGEWKRTRPSNAAFSQEYLFSRSFRLPSTWINRRTIIKFPTPGTAFYLYINDRMVGYTQDSRTPAEWDITRYLQAGTNRVACRMLPQCEGSRIEYPLAAISRPLAPQLISLPSIHITDVKVHATLDTTDFQTGKLDLMLDLNREVHGGRVEVDICGQHLRKNIEPRDWFVSFQTTLDTVNAWTDSTPTLYPLTIRLFDTEGRETERIVKHIGFRHLYLRNGRIFLNGSPLRLVGLRLPPAAADTLLRGSTASMTSTILTLRDQGINALHLPYPAAERWYDLCDSLGLYLFDQANIQTDSFPAVVHDRSWLNAILDRLYNLYKRDRNHPSVVAWSLGSGKANGWCMEEAYRFLKGKDNTRPVVYIGAALAFNTDLTLPPSTSTRLPSATSLSGSRPFIPYFGSDVSSDQLAAFITSPLSSQSLFFAQFPNTQQHLSDLRSLPTKEEDIDVEEEEEEVVPDDGQMAETDLLRIVAAVGNPIAETPMLFPQLLTDGLYADPDNHSEGWVRWSHTDTVTLVFALNKRVRLGEVAINLLHSPADSILAPADVQVRWSKTGKHWSRWHNLKVQNPPDDPCADSVSLRYAYSPWHTRSSQFVCFRFVVGSHSDKETQPPCEPVAKHLMIDEVEIDEK